MKKCKEIRNVKEYLQDKSEEEIDQLKIDLLRKKAKREVQIKWQRSHSLKRMNIEI